MVDSVNEINAQICHKTTPMLNARKRGHPLVNDFRDTLFLVELYKHNQITS